jgi:catechol 2,3-dioxygenase-like lactoylglutathione lyase family enzyme/heme-degrading monooxygenase HmoA
VQIVYDHVDVRVRDLDRARMFYDPFCTALGLGKVTTTEAWIVYESDNDAVPMLSLVSDPDHKPGTTRVAFRSDSCDDVDRIAYAARDAGARAFEAPALCPEYTGRYYASFFEDPEGNPYEICNRGDFVPHVARIWRGRIRRGMLAEYRAYVESTGLADYRATKGNRGAYVLTVPRQADDEILTLSFWRNIESVKAFAGDEPDRARYYPEDEKYLLEFPETVEHFDV